MDNSKFSPDITWSLHWFSRWERFIIHKMSRLIWISADWSDLTLDTWEHPWWRLVQCCRPVGTWAGSRQRAHGADGQWRHSQPAVQGQWRQARLDRERELDLQQRLRRLVWYLLLMMHENYSGEVSQWKEQQLFIINANLREAPQEVLAMPCCSRDLF